jgi:hypothetical protein
MFKIYKRMHAGDIFYLAHMLVHFNRLIDSRVQYMCDLDDW